MPTPVRGTDPSCFTKPILCITPTIGENKAGTESAVENPLQRYQGVFSVTDLTDENQRTYMFRIQASAEAEGEDNFTDIYGNYAKGKLS